MAFPTNAPEWAIDNTYTDGSPNKIRPSADLRAKGYLPDAEPTAQELNWQLNNLYLQIEELKSVAAGAIAQTPVNQLIHIVGDNRNPNVIYGYGSWVPYASGRMIVGAGTSTDANGNQRSFSAGSTGGTYQESISQSQLPAHQHGYKDRYHFEISSSMSSVPSANKETVGFINGGLGTNGSDNDNNTFVFVNDVTEPVGGNQPVNNLSPYITCFIWLRVA